MDTATPSRALPEPVGLNAEFYAHCAAGELRFQRCDDCSEWRHPPRYRCSGCGSDAWSWELSSARGRIYTWTVTHRPLDPFFADQLPYAVVVAETEEGVRVVGNLRGIEVGDLALDVPVEILLSPQTESVALLEFGPAS